MRYLLLLICAILLGSCHSKKKLTTTSEHRSYVKQVKVEPRHIPGFRLETSFALKDLGELVKDLPNNRPVLVSHPKDKKRLYLQKNATGDSLILRAVGNDTTVTASTTTETSQEESSHRQEVVKTPWYQTLRGGKIIAFSIFILLVILYGVYKHLT